MQDRSINERKETPQIKFMNFIQKQKKKKLCEKEGKKTSFSEKSNSCKSKRYLTSLMLPYLHAENRIVR